MTVERILKTKGTRVVSISPEATIEEAIRLLTAEGIGAVVVSADGRHVQGIISERDIVHVIAARGRDALSEPVRSAMTKEVVTCRLRDRVDDMMARMSQGRFRHLPVVEDGAMVGLISIGDVVKKRIEDVEAEATHLREFIAGR